MIYLTGDTHGDFTRLSKRHMKSRGFHLTADDYIIICGDMGFCWSPGRTFVHNCHFFEEKPYTVLWVKGNHENYDMISEFAVEEWHGGKVRHIVRDKVILLERGQVFRIEGKTFFTFGGASSHDIQGGILDRNDPDFKLKAYLARKKGLPCRILRESWWPEELPTEEEMWQGLKNLGKVDNEVDYIITHCCSTSVQNILDPGPGQLYQPDVLTDYFEQIEGKVRYKHWYFGHYHLDKKVDSTHTLLYHGIIPLEDADADFSKVPRPGHPMYQRGDTVIFQWRDGKEIGKIWGVDAYGTFGQSEEPSYDVHCEGICLYKHIIESEIISAVAEKPTVNMSVWELGFFNGGYQLSGIADMRSLLGRNAYVRYISKPEKYSFEEDILTYETQTAIYKCPLKYMDTEPYRQMDSEYKEELMKRDEVSDSILDKIIAASVRLSMGTEPDHEFAAHILKLAEAGKAELAAIEEEDGGHMIEIAKKYDDCIYIEVSNIDSGDKLAYHLGGECGMVYPSIHTGTGRDSILYTKYKKNEEDIAFEFGYFPQRLRCRMTTYNCSDNIKQAVIKNICGFTLEFNEEEIVPGETKVFDREELNQY